MVGHSPEYTMTATYSLIPTERPATLDELALAYNPVVEYQARQHYREAGDHRRSLDDFRQDAWEGVIMAWYRYDDTRGMSFRSYAVSCAGWAILNNLRHVDKNLFNSNLRDRAAYVRLLQIDSLDCLGGIKGDHLEVLGVDVPYHDVPSMDMLLGLLDDARLRFVVDQYYRHGRTLEDIGNVLGITKERVRQLLGKAYPLMRKRLERGKRAIIR